MAGDPLSAFGSVMGVNRNIDAATANFLADGDFFIECIAAPGFDDDALEILVSRPKWRKNVRLLECPLFGPDDRELEFRQVQGGMLLQSADPLEAVADWQNVTSTVVGAETTRDLRFAWDVVRFVKSNAIVLVAGGALCGVGAGQMSRVDSVQIAISKAGSRSRGSVMASDAFFPFPDSIELAAAAGVRAIVQPGGSVKDEEVIAACDGHGIAMFFTGRRHFLH
jgi:phosphoribosylaminoimidazolecarboxamide formyltransferase/IMP cyclohydrolase